MTIPTHFVNRPQDQKRPFQQKLPPAIIIIAHCQLPATRFGTFTFIKCSKELFFKEFENEISMQITADHWNFNQITNSCQSPASVEFEEIENMTLWQISVSLVQFAHTHVCFCLSVLDTHVCFQSCLPIGGIVTWVALPRLCWKSHVFSDFEGGAI